MVFNQVVVFLIAFWVILLTGWVIYRELQYRHFFGQASRGEIRRILEELLKNIEGTSTQVEKLSKVIESIKSKDLAHLQKWGMVRFNPFRDAGGDQSFSIAILDEENSGIILTSLHAREATRVYVKEINKGGSKVQLSKEERQALEQAA